MSLINQMLQDLDARRADMAGTTPYGEQVRAVPERRATHPAWWLVLALAIVLAGLLAWLLLRPAAAPVSDASPRLPLKFDTDISLNASPAIVPGAKSASPAVSATPAPVQPVMPDARAMADAPPVDVRPADEAIAAPLPAPREAGKPAASRPAPAIPPRDLPPPAVPETGKAVSAAPSPITNGKQFKELTAQQRAENEYRKALLLLQQDKTTEALGALEGALQFDPRHVSARQALIGVLLDKKRPDDAARRAREGLALDARQPGLAMILARLQLDKGELHPAIDTLEHTLPYAADQADYQAFLAALLQRDDRHKQAIEHYLQALQRAPQSGVWWMGLGISLQAEQRLAEAREAFARAKGTNTLSAELLAFVEARLGQLPH